MNTIRSSASSMVVQNLKMNLKGSYFKLKTKGYNLKLIGMQKFLTECLWVWRFLKIHTHTCGLNMPCTCRGYVILHYQTYHFSNASKSIR